MSSLSSSDLRSLVVEAVAAGADVIADAATADRWEQPSALEGMTVGAPLRPPRARRRCNDRVPRPNPRRPATRRRAAHAGHLLPGCGRGSDPQSDKGRLRRRGGDGQLAMAAKCRQLADDLASRFADEPEDRLLTALGGRMLTLDDFCRTRLIEVLLHLDDLTTSTGVVSPRSIHAAQPRLSTSAWASASTAMGSGVCWRRSPAPSARRVMSFRSSEAPSDSRPAASTGD